MVAPRRVANPPNPWASTAVEYLEAAPPAVLEVYEEEAGTIVSSNDSPDVPFRYSVNPYRGCFHGCAYCYARPTHQYLGFGAGTDFERKIVVKTNAPELLEVWLRKQKRGRELIAFSGVTDCYQPLEASYQLTRRCLQVCLRYRAPVGVITKGALVERDAELLAELDAAARARVFLSVPFADAGLARAFEPFAAAPERRLRSIATLAAAGVETGVAVAPVIPGLNDDQIPAILRAARDAGATWAFMILLRLPAEAADVFRDRLREAAPLRAKRVLSGLTAMRRGRLSDSRFGQRMSGEGARYRVIADTFALMCRRLGLRQREVDAVAETPPPRQLGLFEGRGRDVAGEENARAQQVDRG